MDHWSYMKGRSFWGCRQYTCKASHEFLQSVLAKIHPGEAIRLKAQNTFYMLSIGDTYTSLIFCTMLGGTTSEDRDCLKIYIKRLTLIPDKKLRGQTCLLSHWENTPVLYRSRLCENTTQKAILVQQYFSTAPRTRLVFK